MTGTASSLKAASHLEMGLPSMPQSTPTGTLIRKVWGELRKILGTEGVLPFTPIWNNPRYVELQDLEGFNSWKKRGIWFYSQLYEGEVLKTYEQLCREYQLAPRGFYQYLQLPACPTETTTNTIAGGNITVAFDDGGSASSSSERTDNKNI